MKTKNLIYSSVLCALSIATCCIMFMPILTASEITPFNLIELFDYWTYVEEYVWGIAAIITTVCAPLLFISSILCILSSCGVIKSKKMDLILYIVNIVLVSSIVAVIVNYFLGLGRTIGARGFKLFQGETYFSYSTAFFYLHCVFSIAMLVLSILNRKKNK